MISFFMSLFAFMWSEYTGIVKKTNPKRLRNALAILASYYRARATKSGIISGLPIAMSVEPTTACNLACPECPSGLKSFTRPTGNIKPALFNKIMDQMSETLMYLTFYFQGEPFIHPQFLNMVNQASVKGVFTSTSTNAHFLDSENARATVESGLDKIIISLDGTDQVSYEKYRKNGNLERVKEGIHNLVDWKKKSGAKTPFISLQFIVFNHNEHQLPQIKKMAAQWGVEQLLFKTAQIYDQVTGPDLLPTDPALSRYRKNGQGYVLKNKLFDHCWRMWHSCVLTWDGKVVPCCFDKDAKYVLGDINKSSFEQIWNGGQYQAFRKRILTARKSIDICKNCSEGSNIWI